MSDRLEGSSGRLFGTGGHGGSGGLVGTDGDLDGRDPVGWIALDGRCKDAFSSAPMEGFIPVPSEGTARGSSPSEAAIGTEEELEREEGGPGTAD